jgi:serine/threonine-protein kinase
VLFDEIGRGGMGAVLRGRDPELGRDLAVKVLLETYQQHPEMVRRFLEEAQIAGQLQHPGVVPVYELGRFPDDRPFFTMKLVKGQTLAELLKKRNTPLDELPRFLGIFEQVCHTVAYAHARGVIHRDLKPANVMVGSFGEVQVMDWGLAKVLSRAGGATEPEPDSEDGRTVIRTARSGSMADGSQAGTVLGTPAYMPPEQANGDTGRLDERADVFSLGAVLCMVLTGETPYCGRNHGEIHRKAMRGDLADAFARLDGCGADAELVRLCKQCLAPEAADRPADAGVVRDHIAAYQAGVQERLRRAELERAAAQVKAAEERKRRKLTAALALAVLALVAAGGLGGLYYQRQRDESARQAAELRLAIEAALDKATGLQEQAHWAEARAVLEQTADRLGADGPADLRQRVERARADLALVDRLEGIRQRDATTLREFDDKPADLPQRIQQGRRDQGLVDRLDKARPGDGTTLTDLIDLSEDERQYVIAFHEAGLGGPGDDPEMIAARVRESPVREQVVAALDHWATMRVDRDRQAWLREVVRRADPQPWRDSLWGPGARQDGWTALQVAKDLLADEPRLGRLQPSAFTVVADALRQRGEDPLPFVLAGQALHPNDFWLNAYAGAELDRRGRYDEAIAFDRAALAVRPDFGGIHNNLGVALDKRGQTAEGIREYRAALVLTPGALRTRINLGNALVHDGQTAAAIEVMRDAVALSHTFSVTRTALGYAYYKNGQLDEAVREFKAAATLQPPCYLAHLNLGATLREMGRDEEALRELKAAVALAPNVSQCHTNLSAALNDRGRFDESIDECCIAMGLDPFDAQPHVNLGNALEKLKRTDEAIREYRTAIALNARESKAYFNLGRVLGDNGKTDEALLAFERAVAAEPRFAGPHVYLALLYREQKRPDEALKECRTALALDAKYALAHNALGLVLRDRKQFAEALPEFETAVELSPRNNAFHFNRGLNLLNLDRPGDAVAAFRKAQELGCRDAELYAHSGVALLKLQQPDEALKEFRKAIDMDADNAQAHNGVGCILRMKKQLDEAIAEHRTAVRLVPDDAAFRTSLGAVLHDKGELDEAIDQYRAAIKADPKFGPPHCNLGLALLKKDQPNEALGEFRLAINCDPLNPDFRQELASAHWKLAQYGAALAAFREAKRLGLKDERLDAWLAEMERLDKLDRKLPAVLSGEEAPADNAERMALASFCQRPERQLHVTATRLYADAFAKNPKLADDLGQLGRYNAACAAAKAAAGRGKEAAALDDNERARHRRQALEWLRADLAGWTKQTQSAKAVEREEALNILGQWEGDSDFAEVRDPDKLKKLPDAERDAWRKFWDDVAAVRSKAGGK